MKTTSIAAAALAMLLTGCGAQAELGGETGTRGKAAGDAVFLATAVGRGNEIVTHRSVAEGAAATPVALTGTIDGVAPGMTIIDAMDRDGFAIRDEKVVVRVLIDRVYKADGVPLDDGIAFVSLPRGAQATDDEGVALGDGPSTITPVEAFRKALPAGTRVIVLAHPIAPAGDDTGTYLNTDAGTDRGATLLEGGPSQAFSIEDGSSGHLSGWGATSYADAVAELEKAFP